MAKTSHQSQKNISNTDSNKKKGCATKLKRTRKSVPRDSPQQRSSIYRGVTRHRWTGRYEAHLWDKTCWNESQNKKGKQVYLGAYDDEEAAAHAYDLAALKYWGQQTVLNFPLSTYKQELQEMEGQSKEEYIGSLRRKSSGFSRGVSKYRGVARHHHNGRWEARIGRVFGNKYLYLGTYATQEEAAAAYDMAAIEYRGLNAVTNFDLSRYIKWLKPDQEKVNDSPPILNPNVDLPSPVSNPGHELEPHHHHHHYHHQGGFGSVDISPPPPRPVGPAAATASSALELLLQSSKFKEMLERTSAADDQYSPSSPPESDPPRRCFPDDIQTYFDCEDSGNYVGGDDLIFAELDSFASTMFQCELDV